jgi:Tfp pilus assembly protein PilE
VIPGVKGFLLASIRDRRRAQAGTTLVELLVALTIAGFGLALVVGTVSTGLLDSTLIKRNAAVQAVLAYEMEQVTASPFNTPGTPYSDCFATENTASPASATGGYEGACQTGFALRADVSCLKTCSNPVQTWTIEVSGLGSKTNGSIQLYKVPHS